MEMHHIGIVGLVAVFAAFCWLLSQAGKYQRPEASTPEPLETEPDEGHADEDEPEDEDEEESDEEPEDDPFEAHRARLQAEVPGTVEGIEKAFTDRFVEMQAEYEADKAGYSVTVQRFGDLLNFHVRRGENRATFAVNMAENMPIVLKEGSPPRREGRVNWWFEYSLVGVMRRRSNLSELLHHEVIVGARWGSSSPIFVKNSRQRDPVHRPWRDSWRCGDVHYPRQFLDGPEIKLVTWGEDDTIRFDGLPEVLHIPHGLGQQVYQKIMEAAASDTLTAA